MVQVGVSDFVDNEAKNARLISIALNVFRTTFDNDREVRNIQFSYYNSTLQKLGLVFLPSLLNKTTNRRYHLALKENGSDNIIDIFLYLATGFHRVQ